MKNKKISVIITTKNSEQHLDKCLKSIKSQTYKHIEIIVVDNNSSDNTKKIAKKYTKKVFNKGPERSAQKNFGAEKAKGNLLYFLDSDFVLEKEVVTQCVEKIEEGYDAAIIHNTTDPSISWIAKIRKFEVDMYKYNLDHNAARFVKKSVFNDIGGYSKEITAGEDYDIQNKLNRKKYKTGFIDAEAVHMGEPTSIVKHMKKYYVYGKDYINFEKKNKKESKKQLGFFRPVYIKNWKKFLKQPLTGGVFIIYHTAKFAAGALGFYTEKIKQTMQ